MMRDALHPPDGVGSVAAGPFGPWLEQARESLRGNGGVDVPCGDCTGCCTSSYLIQVRPEDSRAITRIPAELLVSAAGFPPGHKVLAPRADGTCPMLSQGRCSIYAQRPQTCLDYDCRIFAAAGIDAGGSDKEVINRRVREWQFTYQTEGDKEAHGAVLAAAVFVRKMSARFPGARRPMSPTGIAVLAIKVYPLFLAADLDERSEDEITHAVMKLSREFDEGGVTAEASTG